ncbi:MAG: hypothetical protein K8S55_03815 [Phycisphaerae bacterium]|nr:hypothetical protein [Phycisphaerae bacterium]
MAGIFGMMGLAYGASAAHRGDIAKASADLTALSTSRKVSSVHDEVVYLEERFDKLLLVNAALWELLKERTNLTEDDLVAKVQEVDLQDGVADGKVTKVIKKCPKCNRTMSARHNKCLYCGAEELNKGAFDAV